jgi:hypothetical protein
VNRVITPCKLFRYGEEYATLKARVLRTLVEATASDKPLSSQYGEIPTGVIDSEPSDIAIRVSCF